MGSWYIARRLEPALFTGSLDNSDDSDNNTNDSANDSNDGRVLLHIVETCIRLIMRCRGIVGIRGYCLGVERMNAGGRRLGVVARR